MESDHELPADLRELAAALRSAELTLAVPGREAASAARQELTDQVEDYLLPRLEQMDAPLLMVVGVHPLQRCPVRASEQLPAGHPSWV